MIPEDLSAHILHIIAWHRTWIAAKDFGKIGLAIRISESSNIVCFRCRVLRLEVRVPHEYFHKLQIISIPESAIEVAMRYLSSDAGFKRRLDKCNLNYEDVNEIIRIASDDIVEMNLEV